MRFLFLYFFLDVPKRIIAHDSDTISKVMENDIVLYKDQKVVETNIGLKVMENDVGSYKDQKVVKNNIGSKVVKNNIGSKVQKIAKNNIGSKVAENKIGSKVAENNIGSLYKGQKVFFIQQLCRLLQTHIGNTKDENQVFQMLKMMVGHFISDHSEDEAAVNILYTTTYAHRSFLKTGKLFISTSPPIVISPSTYEECFMLVDLAVNINQGKEDLDALSFFFPDQEISL